MRKLKLQVQITLDGYIAGPNQEMDWALMNWSDDLNAYVTALTEPVGTILLGRKLAEGFIPYWEGVAADSANPEQASGQLFTNLPKVVFSRSLAARPAWPHTEVCQEEMAEAVKALKAAEGGDLIVYGGAEFVSELIQANLIDEYHLLVNPTALGSGLSIFRTHTDLKFLRSQAFTCGIHVMVYAPND